MMICYKVQIILILNIIWIVFCEEIYQLDDSSGGVISSDYNNSDYGASELRLKDYIDDDDVDGGQYYQTTMLSIFMDDYDDPYHLNRRISEREFAEEIKFLIYKNDELIFVTNGLRRESIEDIGCNINDKFTFLIHGWREDSNTEWLPLMVSNFSKYRGGCIILIDYGYHADISYFKLVQRFDGITHVIYDKIESWQDLDLSHSHFFGFSFGARLALAVSRRFGRKVVNSIDICDMAGPGFDFRNSRSDYRDAAENVQCIHTSRDKGTRFYSNCHQNWRLGNCGFSQPGAEDPPYGSHGLCVYYYLLAFERGFYAHKKPSTCTARNPANYWPNSFRMGYMETRKSEVSGELFVPLSSEFPYAVPLISDNDNDVRHHHYPWMPPSSSNAANQNIPNMKKFQNRPLIKRLIRVRNNFIKRKRNRSQ